MELPIHFTYKDFVKNYDKDYYNFSDIYFDSNENDFRIALTKLYEIAVKNITLIELDNEGKFYIITDVTGTEILENVQKEIRNLDNTFDHYKIKMLEFSFKRILEFLQLPTPEPISEKEKGFKLNYKLSLLDQLGALKWLENNIGNVNSRAEILTEIIGGSGSTISDYLTGKNPIKTDVKQNAINFINDIKYK